MTPALARSGPTLTPSSGRIMSRAIVHTVIATTLRSSVPIAAARCSVRWVSSTCDSSAVRVILRVWASRSMLGALGGAADDAADHPRQHDLRDHRDDEDDRGSAAGRRAASRARSPSTAPRAPCPRRRCARSLQARPACEERERVGRLLHRLRQRPGAVADVALGAQQDRSGARAWRAGPPRTSCARASGRCACRCRTPRTSSPGSRCPRRRGGTASSRTASRTARGPRGRRTRRSRSGRARTSCSGSCRAAGATHTTALNRSGRCVMAAPTSRPPFEPP